MTNTKEDHHDFISKYNHVNQQILTHTSLYNNIDERRLVFISLNGLYQSWRICPSILMCSAILILPLKQKWIYHPSKHQHELTQHFVSRLTLFSDTEDTDDFIELLKWKDSQNLVFWMLDDHDHATTSHPNHLITPFWQYFSNELIKIYDPVKGSKYSPLRFDKKWWQTVYNKN
eukprot:219848_1